VDELNISDEDLAELEKTEHKVVNEFLDVQAADPKNVVLELIIPREIVPEIVNAYKAVAAGDSEALIPLTAFLYYVICTLDQAQ
jgi:hypothetical protein